MANKVQKPCKICGKMFTPCADCENDKTMFRWKRVACSPECARLYFAKIEESRQPKIEIFNTPDLKMENVGTNITEAKFPKGNTKTKRVNKKNNESEQID